MSIHYVFYAGQLIGQFEEEVFRTFRREASEEIYNGAQMYATERKFQAAGWYRLDRTPLTPEAVPKDIQLLLLLLRGS